MKAVTGVATAGELVPFETRFRTANLLRLTAALVVLAGALFVPDLLGADFARLAPVTGGYLMAALIGELVWRWRERRVSRWFFDGLLILDGLWLAIACYMSGGVFSPVRYLVVVHVAAVTLIASYRTGLKITAWHTLLLIAVHNAQSSGYLDAPDITVVGLGGSTGERYFVFGVLLWALALGVAWFSAINERELRRRHLDLEALNAMAVGLETVAGPSDVAETLIRTLSETFDFERGLVVTGTEHMQNVLAEVGAEPGPGIVRDSALLAQLREHRRTLLVAGLDPADDDDLHAMLPDAGNLVVVPLSAEGRSAGALILEAPFRAGSRIERRVVAAVERFASYAAMALRNAMLLEQVQRLAATDGLTAIANRRTFETTLEREVARAQRLRGPVSLVMLDIDHFKALNDTYGHQAGDEVLRNVAAALACECREFDTAARYGGEEFAVVLPGCPADEALEIAERFRTIVSRAPAVANITVSAGVATFPDHAKDADDLVRVADSALYDSKRSGRDRVTGVAAPRIAAIDSAS